jgi:sugar phosphate isomerase/epimerase
MNRKDWIKGINKDHKRRIKEMKQYDKDSELLDLKAKIAFYNLEIAIHGGHGDDFSEKEQRRRLWKLSIIERQEDDAFLKRLGLVYISNLSKNEKRRLNKIMDTKLKGGDDG